MIDIAALARIQADRTGCDYADWLGVLKEIQSGFVQGEAGEKAIQQLAEASEDPVQFCLLTEALISHDAHNPGGEKEACSLLVESVDESPYSLKEWVAAWVDFSIWLESREREAGFASMLGYLDCCSQYIEGKGVLPPFTDLVEEMLDAYGFVGEEGDGA